MSDPTEGITRREALQAGSAAAVAIGAGLYADELVRTARAASSGDPRILMDDAGTDADEAGEIVRNGADMTVYSGGAVRNLTDPTFSSVTTDAATINSREVFIQDASPSSPSDGDVWIDTS